MKELQPPFRRQHPAPKGSHVGSVPDVSELDGTCELSISVDLGHWRSLPHDYRRKS
jgi:hypothetical protein